MSRFPDAEDLRDLSSLVDCLQCIHGLETTVVEQDGRTAVLLILRSDRPALLRSAHDFVTTWATAVTSGAAGPRRRRRSDVTSWATMRGDCGRVRHQSRSCRASGSTRQPSP